MSVFVIYWNVQLLTCTERVKAKTRVNRRTHPPEEREQVKGVPRSGSKGREGFHMARRIRKEGEHAITPGKEGIVEGIRVEAARL